MPPIRMLLTALVLTGCEDPFFEIYDGGIQTTDDGSVTESTCGLFESRSHPLAEPHKHALAVTRLTDHEALVVTRTHPPLLYSLTSTDATLLDVDIPDIDPMSAFSANGEIWLIDRHGAVFHGWPDQQVGLQRIPTATIGEASVFLTGSGDPLELYAMAHPNMTRRGRIHRFDGTWSTIWSPTHGRRPGEDYHGGLAWVGPNELYAVTYDAHCNTKPHCVLHYKAGTVVEESLTQLVQLPSTVAFIPGIGMVGGTAAGDLLVRVNSHWEKQQGSPLANPFLATHPQVVRKILPYKTGFFMVSDQYAAQFIPGLGFCDAVSIGGIFETAFDAAVFGDSIAIVGLPWADEPLQAVVLTPR